MCEVALNGSFVQAIGIYYEQTQVITPNFKSNLDLYCKTVWSSN